MARLRKGILTGIIGPLAYSNYKGKQVVKTRPDKDKKKKEPTAAQFAQRNKMRAINAFVKPLKPVIAIGFQASDKLSAYNECVSELLSIVKISDTAVPVIDYPQVKFSRGTLPAPEIIAMDVNPGSITITWNKSTSNRASRKNDEAVVVLHSEAGDSKIFDCIGLRADGSGSVEIPENISLPYHAWIFFSNPKMFPYASKKKVSDTVYLGGF